MKLEDFTNKQLQRLFNRVWSRMIEGDGYQPFGYDRVTLWATKPEWMTILVSIDKVYRERYKECTH